MVVGAAQCHLCGRSLFELWAMAYDIEYGTTADEFSYYRCERCDALSIHPLPADRLDEIYPRTYYSFAGSGAPLDEGGLVPRVKAALDRRRFGRLIEAATTSDPVRVADIGGGSGAIAERLVRGSRRAVEATIVDIDEASIALARERGLEAFLGRVEDFEPAKPFDLILMLNLIEHVADPLGVLRRARKLLAPRGTLCLQTPNYRSFDARLFRHRSWAGLHCPRHWVVFGSEGVTRALGAAGLRATNVQRNQAGSFWAASLLGLRRRVPTPGRSQHPLVESRAYLPLAAAGAGFDFARRPLANTSQVFVTAVADGPWED